MPLNSFFVNKINKFYKYSSLKKDIDIKYRELYLKQKENSSWQSLMNLLGPNEYLPQTDMAMSPTTICHILNEIIVNRRKSIIEFGSGNSTILIAKLIAASNGRIKFFSVESDKDWINVLRDDLRKKGLLSYVELIYAPIKEQVLSERNSVPWYETSFLDRELNGKRFDLVIVDGPQGSLCPLSRYPAIPFLKNYLEEEYCIFLDDYYREDEKQILRKWLKMLNSPHFYVESRHAVISVKSTFISTPG